MNTGWATSLSALRAPFSGRKILGFLATAVVVCTGAVVIPALPALATGVDANSITAAWAQSGSGVALIDGQVVTYSLNANRDSTPDTTGVTISDTLPAGLDYISSDGPGAVGSGTYNSGTRVVSWTNQTLTNADQIWTIDVRVNLSANANITNSFTVTGGGDTDSESVTTNGVLNVVPNPDLPVACRALKVTLVLDSSGSIQTDGAVETVRSAARDFLTALVGTGSQADVVSFSTSADTLLGTMTTITPDALANGGALDNALDGYYTTGSFNGWTNWEDGLREALSLYDSNYTAAGGVTASQIPDLVVFVTDGVPTTFIGGPTGTGTVNVANSRTAAIDEANFIKSTVVSGSQNVKILGLGVGQINGQQLNLDNFLAISGDGLGQGQQATTITPATFPTLDLLTSDFSSLGQTLKDVVSSLCSNAVTITKQVQSPVTGQYSLADGWTMEGNLAFTPVGQSFAWVSPGTVVPNNGRSGITASPAGQPNTLSNVVFQWTTTGIPTTQTFSFKENPTADQNLSYSFDSVACTNGATPVTVTTVNGFFTVTVPYKAALACVVRNKFNFAPAINVDKTANPTTILANGNTTYTYVVTNPGNAPLSNVTLTDNRFSATCLTTPSFTVGNTDAVLAPGETWTYTCTRALTQGTTNVATVTGTPIVGPAVSDTDDAVVTVIAPAINVAKSANPNVIYAGNTVTYTFVVTNVGTNPGGAGKPPLTNITVTDPNCTTISGPVKSGGDDGDATLEGAEVWTYTCSKAVSADVTNTVTATGTPAVGPTVSDTDTAVVNVINPAIDIVKSASAPTVHAGDSVTYTLKVTNVGDDPLSNIVVQDDKCSTLSGPVKNPGNQDGLLEANELWTYTCTRAISATDTNIASATGTDSKGGTVNDTSSVTVNVITPAINIEKAVNKPVVLAGATVVYTMTVTNPGNTPLHGVVVTDPAPQCIAPPVFTPGGDTNNNNLLDPGETWTYTCSAVINADTTNTATVAGQDPLGGTVDDSASAFVDVISPAIRITKVADPTIIRAGESTTYTLNVTNGLSTETITNVVVTDPLCAPVYQGGDVGVVGALEEGETWVYTCTALLTADTTNTATATGTDQLGDTVTDSATAFVEVINPNINVDKTASPTVIRSGDTVTYTYVVTTTSTDPLSLITLTDDKLTGACLSAPVKTGNGDDLLDAGEAWTYTCTTTLTADTTNLATVIGTDKTSRTVTDTDPATVDVIFPAITVEKSADPTIVRSGAEVTYTYVVTNTGDTALGLTLDDDKLDALPCLVTPTSMGGGDQDASFEPGEVWTFECDAAIVSDTTNIVTAIGTPPVGPNVTDTATASVDVIAPAINVVKTASANTIHAGDAVTYTYKVTLGGDNTPLTSVTVGDDKCADAAYVSGDDGDDTLEAGETWIFECTANLTGDTTNIGTATGTAPDDGTVTDTDTQTVDVLVPGIAVVKKVNGEDSVIVTSGTPVTYTYSVTNPGDTPLTVSLDDDKLPALDCLVDHSGDTNDDNKLDPGETWLYTCAGQILADDTTNTVTATGVDSLGGESGTVTATDSADVDVIHPEIVVDKTTSTPSIGVGGTASYSYAVTNEGDVPLANVTVTDDKCSPVVSTGGDTNSNALLDLTETWTYTCSTSLSADTTNTATATGFDVNGNPVTDTDTADVDVINPGIAVDKTTSTPSIGLGDIATYAYAVTNTGDVPLANVTVTDDKCSPVVFGGGDTNSNALLDLTETWTYSCSIALSADTTNTATATGYDVTGKPVTDTDTADVDVVLVADLAIVKQVDKTSAGPGDTVTFTLRVTNAGNGPAANATVTDNVPSALSVVSVASADFVCNTGQAITCTRNAPIAVGAAYTITVTATVQGSAPAGVTTNIGHVTGTDPDPNPDNNTDDAAVTVVQAAILPPIELPATGGDPMPGVQLALAMIGLGGIVLLVARRRRSVV